MPQSRKTEVGLETIFWPSLECSYWGTRSYTPRTHRAPGAEVERGGKEAIGVLLEGMGTKRDGRNSNITEKRTSCLGKDLGQDRPGGDLPFVVSRSHFCARGLYTPQRALEERAAGALAPGCGVLPHGVAPQGPPARTGPSPSPRRVGGVQRTPASPRADNPPHTSSVGLCPAGNRGLPGSPKHSPSWRPGGPRGRPSFVRSAGRREADTYRTPQRGKARATPTPAAETLLCSSDGPYPRQMEGARRWRRRRRRRTILAVLLTKLVQYTEVMMPLESASGEAWYFTHKI